MGVLIGQIMLAPREISLRREVEIEMQGDRRVTCLVDDNPEYSELNGVYDATRSEVVLGVWIDGKLFRFDAVVYLCNGDQLRFSVCYKGNE